MGLVCFGSFQLIGETGQSRIHCQPALMMRGTMLTSKTYQDVLSPLSAKRDNA